MLMMWSVEECTVSHAPMTTATIANQISHLAPRYDLKTGHHNGTIATATSEPKWTSPGRLIRIAIRMRAPAAATLLNTIGVPGGPAGTAI
jgi:hypothetical protein